MRLTLALMYAAAIGCGGESSGAGSATALGEQGPSAAPAAASAKQPTAVPADRAPAAARPDARPAAFAPFTGECPPGHERFESVCVHDEYMRHTPLTRLMDEVIAFRNGAPAPRLGTAPGQQARPDALSADAPRKPFDPSTLDPGALVANPEEIAQREQSVEDAARHRGEHGKQPALPGTKPQAAPRAVAVEAEPGDGQQAQLPKPHGALEPSDQNDADKTELQQAIEKVQSGRVSQSDCQLARANAAQARRSNCSLAPSERALCAALLPQIEASAEALCALAK